jgi:hypothetical protein
MKSQYNTNLLEYTIAERNDLRQLNNFKQYHLSSI